MHDEAHVDLSMPMPKAMVATDLHIVLVESVLIRCVSLLRYVIGERETSPVGRLPGHYLFRRAVDNAVVLVPAYELDYGRLRLPSWLHGQEQVPRFNANEELPSELQRVNNVLLNSGVAAR